VRIVLDTNVVLSALLWRGTPYRLFDAIRQRGAARIFTSPALPRGNLRGVRWNVAHTDVRDTEVHSDDDKRLIEKSLSRSAVVKVSRDGPVRWGDGMADGVLVYGIFVVLPLLLLHCFLRNNATFTEVCSLASNASICAQVSFHGGAFPI
jgi:hypothetical protein